MKKYALIGIVILVISSSLSCSGPKISVEEEKVLAALSNIQQKLEGNASYEEFLKLLDQAKSEIDYLKSNGEKRPCFMGEIDKCYAFYFTGGKAWRQKLDTSDQTRKNDMDLTLSVLQSRAALSIQMASNCYKN